MTEAGNLQNDNPTYAKRRVLYPATRISTQARAMISYRACKIAGSRHDPIPVGLLNNRVCGIFAVCDATVRDSPVSKRRIKLARRGNGCAAQQQTRKRRPNTRNEATAAKRRASKMQEVEGHAWRAGAECGAQAVYPSLGDDEALFR